MGERTFRCLPTSVSMSSGVGEDWKGIANVNAADGATAYCSLAAGQNSETITLEGLIPAIAGSSFPATAVHSVVINVYRYAEVASTIRDQRIEQLFSGVAGGNDLADTATFWSTTRYEVTSYGGTVAVWGALPTVAQITSGAWSLAYEVVNDHGSFASVPHVDQIEVLITVEWPDPPTSATTPTQPAPGTPIDGNTTDTPTDPSTDDPNVQQGETLDDLIAAAQQSAAVTQQAIAAIASEADKEPLVWLIETQAYNEATGETVELYWSNSTSVAGFRTRSTDSIGEVMFEPRATQPLEFIYSLFASPDRISGEINTSSGVVEIDNADGAYDIYRKLGDYHFWQQPLRVRVGSQNIAYDSFVKVFDGVVSDWQCTEQKLRFVIEDRRKAVNASFQSLRYDGTGGVLGGDAGVTDQIKPAGMGSIVNATAKGIDGTSFVFAFNSNFPSKSVTQTRVNGASVSPTVDLINSTLDFAAAPAGEVTVDFEGWEARNAAQRSREGANAAWQKVNCTAVALSFGFGDDAASKGFRVTATSADAVLIPANLESVSTWLGIVHSVYARLSSGVGVIRIGGDTTDVQLSTAWRRVSIPKLSFLTNTGTIYSASSAKLYGRSSGSFITDGYTAGMFIITSGYANAGNNGISYITAVVALNLTVETTRTMVNEAAGASVTITTRTVAGIVIPNSGDVIEFDWFQAEAGLDLPSPPIETADAVGLNYPETFAAQAKFILTASAGRVPFLDFNETQFEICAQKFAQALNFFNDDTDYTVLDVLTLLCNSVLAYILVDEDGLLYADRVGLTEVAPLIRLADTEILPSSDEMQVDQPIRQAVVKYARNYTKQQLGASVSVGNRERWRRPWLTVVETDEDVEVYTGTTADATMIVETALSDTADASVLTINLVDLFKAKRARFSLDCPLIGLSAKAGRPVRISGAPWTHARGEARTYRDALVISKKIDAANDRVTLGVFL